MGSSFTSTASCAPSTKRKSNFYSLLALAVLIVGAVYALWQSREPRYEGHSLSWHLAQLYDPDLNRKREAAFDERIRLGLEIAEYREEQRIRIERSKEIVRQHAAECVAILTNWLAREPSIWKQKITIRGNRWVPKLFQNDNRQQIAFKGLADLADVAAPALPLILRRMLSTNAIDWNFYILASSLFAKSTPTRKAEILRAIYDLQEKVVTHTNIYANADNHLRGISEGISSLDPDRAVTTLILFQDAVGKEKRRFGLMLSRYKRFPDEMVPYFENVLKSSADFEEIENALHALGNYKAERELPLICPFLNHTNCGVQMATLEAIRNITAKPKPPTSPPITYLTNPTRFGNQSQ